VLALYECRCSPSWWRVGCCGGLPPPGKGPSPAVWGEGLSRLPLDAGCELVLAASVLVALQNGPTRGPPSLPANLSPVTRDSQNRKVL